MKKLTVFNYKKIVINVIPEREKKEKFVEDL